MEFSIVVPTYNRQNDLKEFLDSLLIQSILPKEVIIVDDGALPKNFVDKKKKIFGNKGISLIYYKKDLKKENRGVARSKNIGLKLLNNKIIFVFDDDIVLLPGYLERIMNIWSKEKGNQKLAGVAGVILNYRKKSILEKFFNQIFRLCSEFSWDVTETGFQVWDDNIKKREKAYYVHGCLASYNKEIAVKIPFRALSSGRTALEDVDFCQRVKKRGYYFIVEPEAKVIHKQSKVSRDKEFTIGFKEGCNRKLIFRDNSKKTIKNYVWFFWSNAGWILRQFLAGHFLKGFGMLRGYFTAIKDNQT